MVTLTRVKVLKTKRKSMVTLTRVKVLKTKRKSMVILTRVKVLKTKRKSMVILTWVKVLKTKSKSMQALTRKNMQALTLGDKSVLVPNTQVSAPMSIQVKTAANTRALKTAANTRANARIDAREIDVSYFNPMLHSEFLVIARDSSAFV
jgi:hypothetical protein